MFYTYRHMSSEEREEIAAQRQARGYPTHSPPHPLRGSGQYLLTAANYEHRHIMADLGRRTDFESRLLGTLQKAGIETYAWVRAIKSLSRAGWSREIGCRFSRDKKSPRGDIPRMESCGRY